uniref:Apple domain-containing protein n=1 Tax=Alexandrium andersonii TaxID=327968 RepID=A0A7S2CYS4_9DINO
MKVHEDAPEKCPAPCGVVAPARPAMPSAPAVGEVHTAGPMEPRLSLHRLHEAKGSDGCLIEPNLKYIVSGGWTHKIPGVSDPRVCCRHCQSDGGCNTWTWTDWATDAHGAECLLHGGHVVNKMEDDGYVSGLPKLQAVREASVQSHR